MPSRRVDAVHVVGEIDADEASPDVFEDKCLLGHGEHILQGHVLGLVGRLGPGVDPGEFSVNPHHMHAV